ncbi:hypothetical protein D3C81_1965600 [compost metagenome]
MTLRLMGITTTAATNAAMPRVNKGANDETSGSNRCPTPTVTNTSNSFLPSVRRLVALVIKRSRAAPTSKAPSSAANNTLPSTLSSSISPRAKRSITDASGMSSPPTHIGQT